MCMGARQPGPSPLGGRACASLGSATNADVDAVAGQGGCDPGAPYHAGGRPRLRVCGRGRSGPSGGCRPRPGPARPAPAALARSRRGVSRGGGPPAPAPAAPGGRHDRSPPGSPWLSPRGGGYSPPGWSRRPRVDSPGHHGEDHRRCGGREARGVSGAAHDRRTWLSLEQAPGRSQPGVAGAT